MDWLRLYVDVLDDEKVAKMSDRTYRIFTYLMLVARERDQSGVIDLPIKDIAWRLRMPSSHVHKAIRDLESLNILSCNDGVLEFINWTKRQYKSDNVTERVQRFRKRSSNVSSNVIEQNRTDTEAEADISSTGVEPDTNPPSNGNGIKPEKKLYLESVKLTDDEHGKLILKYGEQLTSKAIEILNNAIQSKGYKYKSHYHTLIGWPMKEAKEQGGGSKWFKQDS